jgi:putative endonuclease
MAKHNELGKLGEKIAARFLSRSGLEIIETNFLRPYGEIDIVSRENSGKYRFIEVKTVSWETGIPISHETYRPEENVHAQKIRKLMHVIEAYLLAHHIESDWQFDVVAVYLDRKPRQAKVRHLKNIILGS